MKEVVKLKEEFFWAWLAQGSPEAVDGYWLARRNAAVVVTKAKTRVWEEFTDTMEKGFWFAPKKLWQTGLVAGCVQQEMRTVDPDWGYY